MATAAEVAVRNMNTAGISSNLPEGRPPFVRFELRQVEDRDETIKQGHWVGRDVAYALITPRGSKDVHEQVATVWLENMAQEVREERFPQQWLNLFTDSFKRWTDGHEAKLDGTSLREWPPIRPAQLRMLTEVGIHTVEDLANANEEAIGFLGMGGRALATSAKNWLQASKDLGVPTAKIQALTAENDSLKLRTETLERHIQALMARQNAKDQAGAGNGAEPARAKSIVDEAFEEEAPVAKVRKL